VVRRTSRVDEVRQGLLAELRTLDRGAKLPNEQALADRYAVSRATVREAVLGLLEAGYVTRRHGSGTFVADAPRGRHALETTVSYTAMIRESGRRPAERVLSKEVRPATDAERDRLGLPDGEQVVEVERLRLADERPVIYSRDRIPESVLGRVDLRGLDHSLYVVLEWAGHRVARASAQLAPTVADAGLATLLDVAVGAPLLHIDQTDRDGSGRAVMLSHEWHVADAFDLVVNRRSSPGGAED
jgi:GntR family transcriptional regulator